MVRDETYVAEYDEAMCECADERREALAVCCILHPSPHVEDGPEGSSEHNDLEPGIHKLSITSLNLNKTH